MLPCSCACGSSGLRRRPRGKTALLNAWGQDCKTLDDLRIDMVHHLTHVAATDGSVKGKRCAWGVWEGMASTPMPTDAAERRQRERDGEREEDKIRAVSNGMWGGALPARYDIQDAELVAILKLLRKHAAESEREGVPRRILVLSYCQGVLQRIERAWRRGHAHGTHGSRTCMLEEV